jgi:LysR family hca operon transcriptional activator
MELRHLRYFIAVAAHGSFNRAAQVLHLTQPALSRQVKDLEDEIGVPLVVRGANYVTLTSKGETFYEDARDLLARADKAVERARGECTNEVVRVGYLPAATAGIMPVALEKFQAMAPRVRIELTELTTSEMKESANAGRLDLVILAEVETRDITGFQWLEFRRIVHTLVMPASHPLARLKKISPKRLQDVALVGLGKENFPGYLQAMRSKLRPFGVTPRFVALINDGVASLYTAVEANRAAAILVDGMELTMPRTLVSRPFSPSLTDTPMMVGIPEVRPSPHAEVFARLLREQAAHLRTAKK